MTRDMKRLLRELDLEQSYPMTDAKAVKRRVNAALNADPSERKAFMRQKIKMAAVLVAAAVALTGTALAVGPTMWTMLTKALGSFAPYAQVIEGASVTDNGLKVTVEAVLSDEETTTAYVSVTDLKGDRLDENTRYDDRRTCVSYDAESRTALFVVRVRPSDLQEDGTMALHFERFQPGYIEQPDLAFPKALLKDQTLSTQSLTADQIEGGLPDGEADALVLVPGQTPAAIAGTDLISVSSAGFDHNGIFHILYEFADGVSADYEPLFTPTFDDREQPNGYYSECTIFNGGKHMDVAYSSYHSDAWDDPALITRENVSHLTLDNGYCYLNTKPEIKGDWALSFSANELPRRTITVSQPIGGLIVKSISFTAISATADVEKMPDTKQQFAIPGLPLTLYLEDGKTVPVKDRWDWRFDEAIDPEDVTAIAIGMWYIPLDGDTALPGHWLTELPQ